MSGPPPPPDWRPPRAPHRPGRGRLLGAALIAAVLILAGVTLYWALTHAGPFGELQPSEWALRMTQVSNLHARGLDGVGVVVCVVDTGVDLSHPDLAHVSLRAWRDVVQGRTSPYDDEGHGTAMAGIILADGFVTGVAPAAVLIAVKAITATGSGTDEGVANAVDFCARTRTGTGAFRTAPTWSPSPSAVAAIRSWGRERRTPWPGRLIAGSSSSPRPGTMDSRTTVTCKARHPWNA